LGLDQEIRGNIQVDGFLEQGLFGCRIVLGLGGGVAELQ